jgi:hypothetical protein
MEEKHRAQKLQEWREQQAQIRVNLESAKPQPSASIVPGASPAPRPERSEERVQAQADPSPKPAHLNSSLTTSNRRVTQRAPPHFPRHASRPNPQRRFLRRTRTQLTPQSMAIGTEPAFLSKPKRWGSGETERSLVFRRLGDAKNEERLVCLRFLQEAQHLLLDWWFTRKFGKPSWRVRSRFRVVPFAFTAGLSVPPKRVSRDPFPVLSAIPRSFLDAPGSGAGYVDHPDEPSRAFLSGRCIRGNEAQSSFQPFGWSVRISLLDATQHGVSTTYQEGGAGRPFVVLPVPLPTPFDWPVAARYLVVWAIFS